jgi:hypothetical protein
MFVSRSWLFGSVLLFNAARRLVELTPLSCVLGLLPLVLGLALLRGVSARMGPRSIKIVPRIFARQREISYTEIVGVQLTNLPSSSRAIVFAPGFQLAIERSSAEVIILRTVFPWLTGRQKLAVQKLHEQLTAVCGTSR